MSRVDYIPKRHRRCPYQPLTVRWSITYAKDRRPYHYLWELRIGTDPYRRPLKWGTAPTNASAYRAIHHVITEYSYALLAVSNGGPWDTGERFTLPQ